MEDKEAYEKYPKELTFPYEVTNFKRQTKVFEDKDGMLEFLLCREEMKPLTLILAAKIHPSFFISVDTHNLISHYSRYKRYGMNFLYPEGVKEIPSAVLISFDIISNEIDKAEKARTDKMNRERQSNQK